MKSLIILKNLSSISLKSLVYVVTVLTAVSCADMDEMQNRYSQNGTFFAPMIDSIAVHSGKYSVMAEIHVDSRLIDVVRVFWNNNNRTDSFDIAVNYTPGVYSVPLENMEENTYRFWAVGIDRYKNYSLRYETKGTVYGDRYQSMLTQRTIRMMDSKPGKVTLYWTAAPVGTYCCELKYESNDGTEKLLSMPGNTNSIAITDLQDNLRFRTLYLPEANAIDTFYTAWQDVTIEGGVFAPLPKPVGQWEFNDAGNMFKATIGKDLIGVGGGYSRVAGYDNGRAVRVALGSHFLCIHDIPAGPSGLVDEHSIMMDIKIHIYNVWYCLLQTDLTNRNDGDMFIRTSGGIGVGTTGYSSRLFPVNQWARILMSFKRNGWIRVYVDGELFLQSSVYDNRFFLDPAGVLIFADEDGDDAELDVDQIAIWNVALTPEEVNSVNVMGTDLIFVEDNP